MKLVNFVYLMLLSINEVNTAEEYSSTWFKKNKNWFARQKFSGHDFSIDAGINCLSYIRARLGQRRDDEGRQVLAEIESLLSDYLFLKHKVSDISAFATD